MVECFHLWLNQKPRNTTIELHQEQSRSSPRPLDVVMKNEMSKKTLLS